MVCVWPDPPSLAGELFAALGPPKSSKIDMVKTNRKIHTRPSAERADIGLNVVWRRT
jgi:hypothetical protein